MAGTSILVTEDSPKVERSKRLVESGGFLSRLGVGRERSPRDTFYYPYYFQSWKITVHKTLGRVLRARLFTGVNAITRSAGPASGLPACAEVKVSGETVLAPRAAADEATRLGLEYMKSLVGGRYRPSKPPVIEQEACQLIYVPYYAYSRDGDSPSRAVLVEGMTGSRGRMSEVPAIGEVFRGHKIPAGAGEGG